jgi:hypothetical protein
LVATERQSGSLRQGEHAGANLGLDLESVILDLEEIVVGAEHVAIRHRGLVGTLVVVLEQIGGDLALRAGGQRDQAFGVAREDLVIDPRLVVEALEERRATRASSGCGSRPRPWPAAPDGAPCP